MRDERVSVDTTSGKAADVGMPWIESPYAQKRLRALHEGTRADGGGSAGVDPAWLALAETYHRDGFVVFDFPLDGIEQIASDVARTLRGRYGDERRIMHAWRHSPHVRALACAPRILEMLAFLYGRPAFPFQTLNFDVGTQQRMHSDSVHFHSWPSRYMCGVWVALEDVDESNGPLMYYPGSHRLPVIGLNDLGIRHLPTTAARYGVYENFIEHWAAAHGLKRHTAHMRRGQAAIWAANVLHGGAPVADATRTRLSQVTHYFFSDCMYHSPIQAGASPLHPFLMDVQDIRTGAYVQRQRDYPGPWHRGRTAHVAHVLRHEGLRGAMRRAARKWGFRP